MDNTNQIVSKLKAINDNLLETIQILNLYLKGGILPPLKVDSLKELKQTYSFNTFSDIIEPIKEDKQLTNNIVNAVFLDLWKFTFDFLDLSNFKQNDKKFNEYRVKIIQIGNEIDFYLDAIDCLRYNLNSLHMFFTTFAIPFTGKWSIDKYGINLDYNDLLLEALNEYDLTKRKEFILKKLHTAELFKLQNTVDKEDFDEFDDFIDKCYKVVESIDFHIKNATTTVSIQKKQRTFLDEKREMNEAFNNPEAIAAMEEASQHFNRKLTDKDIELVTIDCNTINEVFTKGFGIFEFYFSNNFVSEEDIKYLKTYPFAGLLSDNFFQVSVLSQFDDPIVLGSIFDICFADTIERLHIYDFTFCTTPDLNNEPRLKEHIKTILKNKENSVLLKDNLLSYAKEIRVLIDLVYSFTSNPEYIKKVNLEIFKKESFLDFLENETSQDELPENYINNGGVITTGTYNIEDYFKFFQAKNPNKELFLVDKLEISLAHYASNYKQNCDNYWETYKFDPNYFNEFIPGELLTEFNLQLHDFIKPLNNQEINRFLIASLQQFRTHTPEKRKVAFFEIYHDVYWYPNYLKYTGSTSRENYVIHVWKLYSNHFYLFQEATQNAFDIFKASLTIGSLNLSNNTNLIDNKNDNKSETLKSELFEYGFLEISKVKSLSHDGQSKLFDLLVFNDTPYNVAFLDYIGFFKHLENDLLFTKVKIYKKISTIFNCSDDTLKGNMLALNEHSKIDKSRYTAHLHKEKVKTDYNSLK